MGAPILITLVVITAPGRVLARYAGIAPIAIGAPIAIDRGPGGAHPSGEKSRQPGRL
jgi:hypothetical protein